MELGSIYFLRVCTSSQRSWEATLNRNTNSFAARGHWPSERSARLWESRTSPWRKNTRTSCPQRAPGASGTFRDRGHFTWRRRAPPNWLAAWVYWRGVLRASLGPLCAIYKRRIGIGQRRRTVFTDGDGHTRKHLHVHAGRQASDGFRAASSAISRSPMGHAGCSLGIFVSNRRRNLPDLAFLNYNDTEHVRRKKLSSIDRAFFVCIRECTASRRDPLSS